MKKFKLIKLFPTSLKLGEVILENDLVGNTYKPKDWPEYFEEVKEFPKIITLRRTKESVCNGFPKATLWKLRNDGNFSPDGSPFNSLDLEYLLKYEHEIYQVQVESGEIFTVGDKVKYCKGNCDYTYFVIDHFFISHNLIMATSKKRFDAVTEFVTEIEKYQEPLFITEDGVEITIPNLEVYLVNPTTLAMVIIEAQRWDKTRLVFYHKKNAENYINKNKPRFSKKDIEDALELSSLDSQRAIISINTFKQRLGIND
jgi:hypothetical protein